MRVLEDSKGRFLLCGVIKEISDGKGKAAGRCVNVRIENKEWNSDAGAEVCNLYEVTFWDSEKLQLKSRFEKAKFEVGSFISVLFYKNENEEYKGNAVDFKKTGLWELNEKSCVLIGVCIRTNVFGEGADKTTVATVPYNAWMNGETKDIFVGVRFNDKYKKIQERSYKLLSPEDKKYKKCIVECGTIEQNLKGYYGTYGKNFELI